MPKIAIIGAGIGGLTTAIALQQAGFDVEIYERAPELKEVGAGLSLWPNATKLLRQLGLGEALDRISVIAPVVATRNPRGDILTQLSATVFEQRYGAAVCVVHRAELLALLGDALDGTPVHLGCECTGFEQDSSGVTIHFAGGETVRADALIGADGINSAVRSHMFGRVPPRYSGYTAWRAITTFPTANLPSGESWGCGSRFGLLPVDGKRVYWFATKNAPPNQPPQPNGHKPELLDLFRDWFDPIPTLIGATPEESILRNDIVDRPPLSRWSEGRVTLLGDAAHAMTPNMGQGACQAIEDGVVLARCLKASPDIPFALELYQTKRLDRANKVVNTSYFIGNIGQLKNPLACRLRDFVAKITPASRQLQQFDWVVGYEIE
ncbi:MAG: FAD-dependent monooxygenase [Anaerolineae bacterium]|nr:FAD-dependent monooxygenase [Anaerolineae bacterium]